MPNGIPSSDAMQRAHGQARGSFRCLSIRGKSKRYRIAAINQHWPCNDTEPVNGGFDTLWKFVDVKAAQPRAIPMALESSLQESFAMRGSLGSQRSSQRGNVIASSKNVSRIRYYFNVQAQMRRQLRAVKVACSERHSSYFGKVRCNRLKN
jgi:hypothetical protein